LSSRNGYLDEQQRSNAPAIYRTLSSIAAAIQAGEQDLQKLLAAGIAALHEAGLRTDYLEIREAASLKPVSPEDQHLVILAAAFSGTTRLIDNLTFERPATA
jgi:pantoate--beta-alanine ligase